MLTPVHALAAVIETAFFDLRAGSMEPTWLDQAQPYLDVMHEIQDASGFYGLDPAGDILNHFLDAAEPWQGSLATHIKRQLRQHLKEANVPH